MKGFRIKSLGLITVASAVIFFSQGAVSQEYINLETISCSDLKNPEHPEITGQIISILLAYYKGTLNDPLFPTGKGQELGEFLAAACNEKTLRNLTIMQIMKMEAEEYEKSSQTP